MPHFNFKPFDAANTASKFPEPLRKPGGAVLGLLSALVDAENPEMLMPQPLTMPGKKSAVKAVQGATGALDEMVRATQQGPVGPKLPKVLHPQPNRWEAGISPKPSGALHEVLSRAGEKSVIGDDLTPGEKGLLEQFSRYAGSRR